MATALQAEVQATEIPVLRTAVTEALRSHNWKSEILNEKWVRLNLVGDNSVYQLTMLADEQLQTVTLRIGTYYRVPEQLRLVACEFLNRVNCELRIGSFQLDYDDGEVIFRAGIDVEGGSLAPTMVNSLIDAGIWAYDWYYPGLMRVTYCLQTPEEAIRSLSPNHPQAA